MSSASRLSACLKRHMEEKSRVSEGRAMEAKAERGRRKMNSVKRSDRSEKQRSREIDEGQTYGSFTQ